jgi:hypothetical protein
MKRHLFLTFLALSPSLSSPPIAAAPTKTIEDRVDASFSSLKNGMSEERARKLKNVEIVEDEPDGMTVIDSAGVIHDFYDGLWQKIIIIQPEAANQPLRALGIGSAREKQAVIAAVGKFTGKTDMDCSVTKAESAWEIRKFGTHLFCQQFLNEDGSYIWVAFDKEDRLIRAGFQAWDPF